eukprot:1157588-Pelagomonas_calceolata.AAC.7
MDNRQHVCEAGSGAKGKHVMPATAKQSPTIPIESEQIIGLVTPKKNAPVCCPCPFMLSTQLVLGSSAANKARIMSFQTHERHACVPSDMPGDARICPIHADMHVSLQTCQGMHAHACVPSDMPGDARICPIHADLHVSLQTCQGMHAYALFMQTCTCSCKHACVPVDMPGQTCVPEGGVPRRAAQQVR